jgi:hypothetical protein
MAWTARWQLSLPALAVFVVLAGFNPTLVAWQRSSLDENLMLTGLVAMALCAPAPFARPYAFALWGLVAIVAAAAKPTGLVFAAAPVLAMAWDLARERRGEAIRPLAALAAGVAVAAGLTLALYAACGYFRPGPFQGWLAEYNRSLGFVPPLDGLAEYVAAVGHHLPIPASTEAAILVLALAAPFLLAETTFFTRAAWCGLVLALAAGAPFYLYYKRLVPVVPLVFYLACAGAQGLAWRAHHGVTQMRRARPRAAPGAAEPPRVATVHFDAASDPRATSGEFARRIATVVWSLAALTAIRVVLAAAGDGIRETFTDHRDRPAMPAYGALADRFNAAIPPGTVLAAPDSFRVVAFDTPFAYRFTHDMVARHMEHIALDEAVRRDARAAGATVLLLPDDDPADPGRHRFRLVGPAGDGLASSRTSAGEIHP